MHCIYVLLTERINQRKQMKSLIDSNEVTFFLVIPSCPLFLCVISDAGACSTQ